MPLIRSGKHDGQPKCQPDATEAASNTPPTQSNDREADQNGILCHVPALDNEEPVSDPKPIKPLLEVKAAAQVLNEANKRIKRDHKAGCNKDETKPSNKYTL